MYSHITNIIKEKKWKPAWLLLFKVKYSSYVIYKVYWKKAIRSFAKEENQAFWLQNEFYYLINEDKNILITEDTCLNGRITDAAQKLKSQSSKQNRQLPVISQFTKKPNYPFRAVNNEHMQLLHHGNNNHWLLYFCSSGRVQICDSLKNHAGRFTLGSLNALYRNFKDTSRGKLTLSFPFVQKQEDGFNCGHLPLHMPPGF